MSKTRKLSIYPRCLPKRTLSKYFLSISAAYSRVPSSSSPVSRFSSANSSAATSNNYSKTISKSYPWISSPKWSAPLIKRPRITGTPLYTTFLLAFKPTSSSRKKGSLSSGEIPLVRVQIKYRSSCFSSIYWSFGAFFSMSIKPAALKKQQTVTQQRTSNSMALFFRSPSLTKRDRSANWRRV